MKRLILRKDGKIQRYKIKSLKKYKVVGVRKKRNIYQKEKEGIDYDNLFKRFIGVAVKDTREFLVDRFSESELKSKRQEYDFGVLENVEGISETEEEVEMHYRSDYVHTRHRIKGSHPFSLEIQTYFNKKEGKFERTQFLWQHKQDKSESRLVQKDLSDLL